MNRRRFALQNHVNPAIGPEINLITEKIIGCAYTVSNTLGVGFMEKVYENALVHEVRKAGLIVAQQPPTPVFYDGVQVGDYVADMIVENRVLVELKAVRELDDVHFAQCFNYMRATGLCICLLMNFARPKLDFHRLVL